MSMTETRNHPFPIFKSGRSYMTKRHIMVSPFDYTNVFESMGIINGTPLSFEEIKNERGNVVEIIFKAITPSKIYPSPATVVLKPTFRTCTEAKMHIETHKSIQFSEDIVAEFERSPRGKARTHGYYLRAWALGPGSFKFTKLKEGER